LTIGSCGGAIAISPFIEKIEPKKVNKFLPGIKPGLLNIDGLAIEPSIRMFA
jgi:hypothetical protein